MGIIILKNHMPERKYPRMSYGESWAPQDVMDNEARIRDEEDEYAQNYQDALAKLSLDDRSLYEALSSRFMTLSSDEKKEYERIDDLIGELIVQTIHPSK